MINNKLLSKTPVLNRGFIKGRAPGKLTGCVRNLAINMLGCFPLLILLSFIRKTKNAWLKNPTDLLHKNLMKPLRGVGELTFDIGELTSYVGELTRWRNNRYSYLYI